LMQVLEVIARRVSRSTRRTWQWRGTTPRRCPAPLTDHRRRISNGKCPFLGSFRSRRSGFFQACWKTRRGGGGGESLVKRIPLPFLPPPPKISFKWSFHPLPLPPSPPLTKKFDQNIPVRNPLEIPEESLKILWPCLKGIFLMKNEKMV